jgi:hypothetical protein
VTYTAATGVFSQTAGYASILTASTTEWFNFYTTPSTRITAGNNLAWTGNSLGITGGTIGRVARWVTATSLGIGTLFDNGTVAGVNATSSTVAFNVQGTSTLSSIFNVASSTAISIFQIFSSGQIVAGTTTATSFGLTVGTTTQFTGPVITKVVGYASAASTTIDLNYTDIATTTVNRATTFVNPVGTLYDGANFQLVILATTTQTVYWQSMFSSSTLLTLPTTVASGTNIFIFQYNRFTNKLLHTGFMGPFN